MLIQHGMQLTAAAFSAVEDDAGDTDVPLKVHHPPDRRHGRVKSGMGAGSIVHNRDDAVHCV